jgi:hypothetical protein
MPDHTYNDPIAKPFTAQQRKLFHAAENSAEVRRRKHIDRDTASRLANEADDYAREGKEKKKKKASSFIDLRPTFNLG